MNNKWFPFRVFEWKRNRMNEISSLSEQNELRAKFNWMTINSSGGERRKNERVSKRASMRANDHGSRVLRRSINECICTRVPCNFMYLCPSAWVCLRFFVFIFVHFQLTVELLWFHISHHQSERDARENVEYGECDDEQKWRRKKLSWSKRLKMMIGYEFELVWLDLAVSHVCVCVRSCVSARFLAPSLVYYIVSFFFSSRIFYVYSPKKNSFLSVVWVKLCVCAQCAYFASFAQYNKQ